MRNVLLITSTVTPLAGLQNFTRSDPRQRLDDYRAALGFYQDLACFDRIVFAENSASDISLLQADAAGRCHPDKVEFISFFGLDYPASHGRAYGEMKLVDHAVAHSSVLRDLDVIVWKVTGRYICRNIEDIVNAFPRGSDLYCHMRNYPARLCELYMLAWTQRGYEHILKGVAPHLRNDLTPGVHTIEETLFRSVVDQKMAAGFRVTPRFRTVPVVEGIRAWDNSTYSDAMSAKLRLRRAANALAPWLWI